MHKANDDAFGRRMYSTLLQLHENHHFRHSRRPFTAACLFDIFRTDHVRARLVDMLTEDIIHCR